jgi:hypothetical protein
MVSIACNLYGKNIFFDCYLVLVPILGIFLPNEDPTDVYYEDDYE